MTTATPPMLSREALCDEAKDDAMRAIQRLHELSESLRKSDSIWLANRIITAARTAELYAQRVRTEAERKFSEIT